MDEPRDRAATIARKARQDMATCELLLPQAGLESIACFHAQQAAEKALKALLAANAVPYPRTHDMETLLNLALPHAPALGVLREQALLLTLYSTDLRYGELPVPEPTSDDAEAAVQVAARVCRLAFEAIDPEAESMANADDLRAEGTP